MSLHVSITESGVIDDDPLPNSVTLRPRRSSDDNKPHTLVKSTSKSNSFFGRVTHSNTPPLDTGERQPQSQQRLSVTNSRHASCTSRGSATSVDLCMHMNGLSFTMDEETRMKTLQAMPHERLTELAFSMMQLLESASNPLQSSGRASRARRLTAQSLHTSDSIVSLQPDMSFRESHHVDKKVDSDGNKTINKYTVLADLGKGAYGKVKLGVDNTNDMPVAIKILNKTLLKKSCKPESLNREIAVMKKLKHRNVVALYEVIDDPQSNKLYLIMQYVDQGPIVRIKEDFTCTPLSESLVKEYVRQLISGLRYLHKHSVVHRDIKPDNILLARNGTVFYSDFGVSEIVEDQHSGSVHEGFQGTPIFLAPELLRTPPSQHVNGFLADVWALGVTIYFMLFGKAPFSGENYAQLVNSIRSQNMFWPHSTNVSPRWKEILSGMLEKDANRRLTLAQVKNHPFFQEGADDVKRIVLSHSEIQSATTTVTNFINEDDTAINPTEKTKALISRFVRRLRARMSSKKQQEQQQQPPNGTHAIRPMVRNSSLEPDSHRRGTKVMGEAMNGVSSNNSHRSSLVPQPPQKAVAYTTFSPQLPPLNLPTKASTQRMRGSQFC